MPGRVRMPPRLPKLYPAATSGKDVPLLLLTLTAAFTSIAALLLHWAGWIRMPYAVSFITLPGMVLLLSLTIWAGRTSRTLLFDRIKVGVVGGLLGIVGYDVVRFLVQEALPFLHYDAFIAMPSFGRFITGKPPDSAAALLTGWAYHVSNGLTFAIAYSVVAGPARWWWGLVWGAGLQIAMTVVYPGLFDPVSFRSFVTISIVGHAVFGTTVGVWCERHATRSVPVHG